MEGLSDYYSIKSHYNGTEYLSMQIKGVHSVLRRIKMIFFIDELVDT